MPGPAIMPSVSEQPPQRLNARGQGAERKRAADRDRRDPRQSCQPADVFRPPARARQRQRQRQLRRRECRVEMNPPFSQPVAGGRTVKRPPGRNRCVDLRRLGRAGYVPKRARPWRAGPRSFSFGEHAGSVAATIDAEDPHRGLDPLGNAVRADPENPGDLLGFHMPIDQAQALALPFAQPGDPVLLHLGGRISPSALQRNGFIKLKLPNNLNRLTAKIVPSRAGLIVAIASNAGIRTAVTGYDEYGMPGATNTGRFAYTGQIRLPELGMYYYKARMYSAGLGRFLQVDPIGYQGGINLYGYVTDDPINATDPTGESGCGTRIMNFDSASCSGGTLLEHMGDDQPRQPHGPLSYAADSGGASGGDTPGRGHNSGDTGPLPGEETASTLWGVLRFISGKVGGAIGLLITPTSAEAPAPNVDPRRPSLPSTPSQVGHIFRNAPGHYPHNTLSARNAIRRATHHRYYQHTDRFGNDIYARMNRDGSQTWLQVRNGVIQNAGLNPYAYDMFQMFP
jgi:RHS repeat-associated protein